MSDDLKIKILSSEVPEQIEAIENAIEYGDRYIDQIIEALTMSKVRHLIAVRLSHFGKGVIKPLQALLNHENEEVQVLSALVLLELDDISGVKLLVNLVEKAQEYSGWALNLLSKKNLLNLDNLYSGLLNVGVDNDDCLLIYIDSIHSLGGQIPSKILGLIIEKKERWKWNSILKLYK